MASSGVILKQCGCRNGTGRRLAQSCPHLAERGNNGNWNFDCSDTNLLGRCERARWGGYPSQVATRNPRDEWPLRGVRV
jgi:hypothetical protein